MEPDTTKPVCDPFAEDKERNLALLEREGEARSQMVKTCLVMNGGAAAAMLALIGHLATSKESLIPPGELTAAVACFALGVLFTAGASGCVFAQRHVLARNDHKYGTPQRWTCWMGLCWFAACLAFVVGVFDAVNVFSAAPGHSPQPQQTNPPLSRRL